VRAAILDRTVVREKFQKKAKPEHFNLAPALCYSFIKEIWRYECFGQISTSVALEYCAKHKKSKNSHLF